MKFALVFPLIFLCACSTPAGRQAKRDTAAIAQNTKEIDRSTSSAVRHIQNVQRLNVRIDAKDKVIAGAIIDP